MSKHAKRSTERPRKEIRADALVPAFEELEKKTKLLKKLVSTSKVLMLAEGDGGPLDGGNPPIYAISDCECSPERFRYVYSLISDLAVAEKIFRAWRKHLIR
ncbi:MAG: hypothetical protein LAP85_07925 [Acidobacteriia bacterium]|nr:hypothetical protein [Terriglobia bacterium]